MARVAGTFRQVVDHLQALSTLALLASAQPKSSIHARRAMVELAKAWNEVKKDFPQPQKREPERDAPLLRFNTETAPNAPPLVVNGGWADVAITV